MYVSDVPGIIGLVTNNVLPEAPLPYSPLPLRNPDLRAPLGAGKRLHEAYLIALQRLEKSSSPAGKVQTQCRWSGKTTQASI